MSHPTFAPAALDVVMAVEGEDRLFVAVSLDVWVLRVRARRAGVGSTLNTSTSVTTPLTAASCLALPLSVPQVST